MKMNQLRLFVAIYPDDEIRNKILSYQAFWAKQLQQVRWTRFDDLHLTLAFMAEFPANRVEQLSAAIHSCTSQNPVMSLQFDGVLGLPSKRSPRIIGLSIADKSERLRLMQSAILTAVEQAGGRPDRKPFRPHITIGRIKEQNMGLDTPALDSLLNEHIGNRNSLKGDQWLAASVEIIQSNLHSTGPRYSTIASFRLAECFIDKGL